MKESKLKRANQLKRRKNQIRQEIAGLKIIQKKGHYQLILNTDMIPEIIDGLKRELKTVESKFKRL